MTDEDRLAVAWEILSRPVNYRDDLTVVFDYRDEVRARLRQRDTLPAPPAPPAPRKLWDLLPTPGIEVVPCPECPPDRVFVSDGKGVPSVIALRVFEGEN